MTTELRGSFDLVEFLRDRLDEDFEAVRLVLGVNVMAAIRHGKSAPRWVPSPKSDAGVWDTDGVPRVKFVWARERDHIIRHDPARVLAEVEAKRSLIARGDTLFCECNFADAPPTNPDDRSQQIPHHYDCTAYRIAQVLALPYADHPDYRVEWRP